MRVYIGAWLSLAAFKKPVVRGEPTASERRRAIEETCDGEKARVGRADSYKDSGKGTFEPFHAVLLLAYSIYIYIYILTSYRNRPISLSLSSLIREERVEGKLVLVTSRRRILRPRSVTSSLHEKITREERERERRPKLCKYYANPGNGVTLIRVTISKVIGRIDVVSSSLRPESSRKCLETRFYDPSWNTTKLTN